MKSRLLILSIVIINLVTPAFAKSEPLSNEVKSFAVYFGKFSVGVIISAFIIAFGLWLYSLYKKNQDKKSVDSKAEYFTCKIDDTKTIDEAIRTFLIIND